MHQVGLTMALLGTFTAEAAFFSRSNQPREPQFEIVPLVVSDKGKGGGDERYVKADRPHSQLGCPFGKPIYPCRTSERPYPIVRRGGHTEPLIWNRLLQPGISNGWQ